MKSIRRIAFLALLGSAWIGATGARGQIVINEVVDDERTWDSSQVNPDTREFIELYNAGNTAVNIGDWTLNYWLLGATAGAGTYFATNDPIPTGTMLAAGDYYVIGPNTVPNVDLVLPSNTELFPNTNFVIELRDGPQATGALVDALALETFTAVELANLRPEHPAQVGGGVWGQTLTNNATAPNVSQSIGRYLNGRDSNVNGRDFGYQPVTPGASNNLPQNASHTIPDVNAVAVGTELSANYYASFVLPRVVDPTVVGPVGSNPDGPTANINTKVISASPQGGRAIVAYDETGGGNAAYSSELVYKYSLYAYIETSDLNLNQAAVQSEASVYGIGTTDPFYGTPNQAGLLTATSTQNGNAGIGWHIQRAEAANGAATTTLLQLIDFNDGGDSVPADADWQIIQTIDLSTVASGWHALSIDYNPASGAVVAKYDAQTFNFNTLSGLVGNFYVGYRENLPGNGNTVARPPTYDLFVPTGVAGDYNGNNVVDTADYVLWRNGGPLQNDPTAGVQAADYDFWRSRFGATSGSGSGLDGAAVPEPGTIALLIVAAVFAGWRRRS